MVNFAKGNNIYLSFFDAPFEMSYEDQDLS